MANFENVTYTYYSNTLGRAVIPSAEEFNALKLENIQLMKTWLDKLEEREENGIDSAVCLMMEVDYENAKLKKGDSAQAIASESIGGHSVSYGSTSKIKIEELDAKSTIDSKIEKVRLFCSFNIGVK